ncbi:polymorphic toxin-type HINT domain-containing protein [Kitasatospora sp. NPDC004615]|uniref:polymorphic toxin-type HINT domain-containing protein n=1 Tax=Kitasatospora sp. NPDC004615 TaxID=3364017 RepID=UPI0036925AA4
MSWGVMAQREGAPVHDIDLVNVNLVDGTGSISTLRTTSDHPFWDDTDHEWIPAGQLAPDHVLVTSKNRQARITSVELRPGTADMLNLTVENNHTYYVLAGTVPVLVHNADGPCGIHLALGFRFDSASGANLGQFANLQQAVMNDAPEFKDIFPNPNYWSDSAGQAMIDRVVAGGGKISFNLQGMQDVEGVLAGRVAPGRPTSFELQYICSNSAARAATTFFNGPAPC